MTLSNAKVTPSIESSVNASRDPSFGPITTLTTQSADLSIAPIIDDEAEVPSLVSVLIDIGDLDRHSMVYPASRTLDRWDDVDVPQKLEIIRM